MINKAIAEIRCDHRRSLLWRIKCNYIAFIFKICIFCMSFEECPSLALNTIPVLIDFHLHFTSTSRKWSAHQQTNLFVIEKVSDIWTSL